MWQDVGAPALPRTAESSADRADEDDVDVVDDDDDDGEEVRVPATTASSLCSLAIILCASRKEKGNKKFNKGQTCRHQVLGVMSPSLSPVFFCVTCFLSLWFHV